MKPRNLEHATRRPLHSRKFSRRKVMIIQARRERLVAEMALLRDRCGPSTFIDNAQSLLTRWWSSSTWNAREELLKAADWLIRLEKRSGDQMKP